MSSSNHIEKYLLKINKFFKINNLLKNNKLLQMNCLQKINPSNNFFLKMNNKRRFLKKRNKLKEQEKLNKRGEIMIIYSLNMNRLKFPKIIKHKISMKRKILFPKITNTTKKESKIKMITRLKSYLLKWNRKSQEV